MNDPGPLSDTYDLSPGAAFRSAVVEELRAMHRTIRQLDAVKLVIVDLDDTAWIGVSGDAADIGPHMVEGWPGGIIEALHYVRRRGVLLAIASKNDEERIRSIWSSIVGPLLRLDDFAAVRINWRPKHDNVREILAETKVLCDNAVFIDDNPAERARVAAEFPDIRTLGSNPFELRRILLLAPEFQVSDITPESIARTPMVQSQIHRDAEQASLSTDDFARQQGLKIRIFSIRSERHPRFRRCLELVNKTNQFNTTGRRWQAEQFQAFFRQGGFLAAYEAEDRYTPYGLVGAAVLVDSRIQQWIESCRVIGFGVECAVLSAVVKAWRAAGAGPISADLVRTSINQPCHTLFEEAGFEASGSTWVLAENRIPPSVPYVTVEVQAPFP